MMFCGNLQNETATTTSQDVSSMGSVANVGLMAKKAQEYGSHDKVCACIHHWPLVTTFLMLFGATDV
jgi:hypothetical protein